MAFLKDWITNIVVFILLATIFDMLLAQSAMQKYTRLVISLLLISIIITPLLSFSSINIDDLIRSVTQFNEAEANIENEKLLQKQKREIEQTNSAYILEQMAVHLKTDVEEELINKYNYEIENLEIYKDDVNNKDIVDNIEKIVLYLSDYKGNDDHIEVVQIDLINNEASPKANKLTNEAKEITTFLEEKWKMYEQVEVVIKEGH